MNPKTEYEAEPAAGNQGCAARRCLDQNEQLRLDELLSSARLFHYANFVIAGISWAFCSLNPQPDIQLPLGGFSLPRLQASIALYFVSLALTVVNVVYIRMARQWIQFDERRPPYAWFALGSNGNVSTSTLLWTITPLLLVAIAATVILGQDVMGMGLLVPGILAAGLPFVAGNYLENIKQRTDQRGGQATFSIWLLYWYRITRHLLLGWVGICSGLAVIPQWRSKMLEAVFWAGAVIVGTYVIRLIGGFSIIYLRIDKWGKRFGFPEESSHYPTAKK